MRRGERTTIEERLEILDLSDQGLSVSEISRQRGTTRNTVDRVIRNNARSKELMRQEECCVVLCACRKTLLKWREKEGLPHVKIGGKILYPREAVRQWLMSRTAKV